MTTSRRIASLIFITLCTTVGLAKGQSPDPQTRDSGDETARFDVSKMFVEAPLESLIKETTTPLVPPLTASNDKPRFASDFLSQNHPLKSSVGQGHETDSPKASSTNPKCQPGLVKWHSNFESALTASATSGKPVLLFQLLGKLDQLHT